MPSLSDLLLRIQPHVLEVFAVVTGLLYVLFAIKGNILLWVFGIVSSGLYVWIFFHTGIYAYSLLYVYYVAIGFYGWYNWRKNETRTEDGAKNMIRKTPGLYLMICLVATVILTLPIYFVLREFTQSDMPFTDAAMTSAGMVATWMLTQKYIEQWLFWIIIDVVSCGAMIFKELYPSAGLFLVYAIMAVAGYMQWNKELRKS